jgi:thiamine phosphate synthase YjbQ (UPF0047 family)
MVDITDQTLKAIFESKLENGIVTIFVSGSTAAITTIEYEPGLRVRSYYYDRSRFSFFQ